MTVLCRSTTRRRSAPARLRLRTADRLIFVWLYRLFPSVREAAIVFKPETLVRWHRSGFRLYWRWKSRRRVGRPAVPVDIRDLIRPQQTRCHAAKLMARTVQPGLIADVGPPKAVNLRQLALPRGGSAN